MTILPVVISHASMDGFRGTRGEAGHFQTTVGVVPKFLKHVRTTPAQAVALMMITYDARESSSQQNVN